MVVGLREIGIASAMPSRMVERSRIETRSASSVCRTRWMPEMVMRFGTRSLMS
jgi:hypothetical protein